MGESDYVGESDYNVPTMSAAAAETYASILSLPDLVNNDAGLVRRGRYLTATFLVEAGDTEFLVRVVEGRGRNGPPIPTALLR